VEKKIEKFVLRFNFEGVKVIVIPLQAQCGPEGGDIALFFHDRGTRMG